MILKKCFYIISIAISFVIFFFSTMAIAMDPIDSEELDCVTRQDSLSIYQDSKPTITLKFSGISWGDSDSRNEHNPGYLMLKELDTHVNAMKAEFVICMKDAAITLDKLTDGNPHGIKGNDSNGDNEPYFLSGHSPSLVMFPMLYVIQSFLMPFMFP